jgi:MFS family permease
MATPHPDSVLRHRPFLLFWFARLSVTASYQMLIVAVGWQLYALTGDPFDLGLVGLIQFVPAMLLFLVVGQISDRHDRRRVLLACQIIEAVAAATLLAAVVSGAVSRELIFAAAFILGIARAFEVTVMQIMVPSLVPLPLVPRAVAGSATANQTATIAGPALGGFLYTAGPGVVYGVCLALFAGAALLTLLIRMERSAPSREPLTLKAFFAGFAFIRRTPAIFGVISLDLFAVLLGGVTALLPVFARDVFASGP